MSEFMKACLDDVEPCSTWAFGLAQAKFSKDQTYLLFVSLRAFGLDAPFIVGDWFEYISKGAFDFTEQVACKVSRALNHRTGHQAQGVSVERLGTFAHQAKPAMDALSKRGVEFDRFDRGALCHVR